MEKTQENQASTQTVTQTVKGSNHPALNDIDDQVDQTPLTFWEIVKQAFSLIFQLQKKRGLKRATDLLETNPMSVFIAGLLSTAIFFTLCFAASQIVLHYAGL